MKKKPQSGNEIESPTHEKFGKTFDRGDELEKYREKTQ